MKSYARSTSLPALPPTCSASRDPQGHGLRREHLPARLRHRLGQLPRALRPGRRAQKDREDPRGEEGETARYPDQQLRVSVDLNQDGPAPPLAQPRPGAIQSEARRTSRQAASARAARSSTSRPAATTAPSKKYATPWSTRATDASCTCATSPRSTWRTTMRPYLTR